MSPRLMVGTESSRLVISERVISIVGVGVGRPDKMLPATLLNRKGTTKRYNIMIFVHKEAKISQK